MYRKTDTRKVINQKFNSVPLFQTERKARNEPSINNNGQINPKNRHCLQGLDDKNGRCDQILHDISNGKLKIVENRKLTGSDMEEENEDDDDEEMPVETGTPKIYDTSERDGRYAPTRKNPQEDALQLHTDEKISGENLKTNKTVKPRKQKPKRYGTIPYTGNFWG